MHILLLHSCQAWSTAPPAGALVQSAVFSAQNESKQDFCIKIFYNALGKVEKVDFGSF